MLVLARTNDLAVIKDKDVIGVLDRAYTLRHNDGCRALHTLADRRAECRIGFIVKRRGGIVQY